MEEEIIAYLYNPTVGWNRNFLLCGVIWIILKVIQNIFLKSKTTKIVTKPINSVFCWLFIVNTTINDCFSSKLGNLTVAFLSRGPELAFSKLSPLCRMASDYVWWFYDTGDRVHIGGIKARWWISGLRTTIMETGQWVDGDLYNGRIVLIASYVF
jgi:hypothetical protein